jgi:tetratricopeptide (TPR) repeat protein
MKILWIILPFLAQLFCSNWVYEKLLGNFCETEYLKTVFNGGLFILFCFISFFINDHNLKQNDTPKVPLNHKAKSPAVWFVLFMILWLVVISLLIAFDPQINRAEGKSKIILGKFQKSSDATEYLEQIEDELKKLENVQISFFNRYFKVGDDDKELVGKKCLEACNGDILMWGNVLKQNSEKLDLYIMYKNRCISRWMDTTERYVKHEISYVSTTLEKEMRTRVRTAAIVLSTIANFTRNNCMVSNLDDLSLKELETIGLDNSISSGWKPIVFELIASEYLMRGELKKSLSWLNQYQKIDPQNRIFVGLQAFVLYKMNKIRESKKILAKFLSKRDDSSLYNNLGVLELKTGNLKTAFAHFEKSTALAEKNKDYKLILKNLQGKGIILLSVGKFEEVSNLVKESEKYTEKFEKEAVGVRSILAFASREYDMVAKDLVELKKKPERLNYEQNQLLCY